MNLQILEKYHLTPEEKSFLEYSASDNTAEMNKSKIASSMILGREIKNASKSIKSIGTALGAIVSIMDRLNNKVEILNQNLETFSKETTKLSEQTNALTKKANTLILWYVILTAILALVAAIPLLSELPLN